jgi:hypothetical protein
VPMATADMTRPGEEDGRAQSPPLFLITQPQPFQSCVSAETLAASHLTATHCGRRAKTCLPVTSLTTCDMRSPPCLPPACVAYAPRSRYYTALIYHLPFLTLGRALALRLGGWSEASRQVLLK